MCLFDATFIESAVFFKVPKTCVLGLVYSWVKKSVLPVLPRTDTYWYEPTDKFSFLLTPLSNSRRPSCLSDAAVEFFSLPVNCVDWCVHTRARTASARLCPTWTVPLYEESTLISWTLPSVWSLLSANPPRSSSSRGSCPTVSLISGEIGQLEIEHYFMCPLHLNSWEREIWVSTDESSLRWMFFSSFLLKHHFFCCWWAGSKQQKIETEEGIGDGVFTGYYV